MAPPVVSSVARGAKYMNYFECQSIDFCRQVPGTREQRTVPDSH